MREADQNTGRGDKPSPGTLGEVLYPADVVGLVAEDEWVDLVRQVARGEQAALHGLYARAHAPVFALALVITRNREAAQDVTLDVFHDVWRRAWSFDPANTTVLAWIMNQARSRSLERARFDPRNNGPESEAGAAQLPRGAGPNDTLQHRLGRRIAEATGQPPLALIPADWQEPDWAEVSPGILCKLLANDTPGRRVSMLVRLLPGVEYPPHRHAGIEELHLLEGELWIDDRKLHPGDYNRAQAPTADKRVWSETGCTCVLVTSTDDVLA